ncbi:hypothetical protein J6590_017005 [Homalodisca vitripennis]|nr:hypothetical protein J6590_017005 [Homalodisca vitripennis]
MSYRFKFCNRPQRNLLLVTWVAYSYLVTRKKDKLKRRDRKASRNTQCIQPRLHRRFWHVEISKKRRRDAKIVGGTCIGAEDNVYSCTCASRILAG